MLETIGVLVAVFVGFLIVKVLSRVTSTVRSQEYGKEARRLATTDLEVPHEYYNHLVTTNIEGVKEAALQLRDDDENFKDCSWPRLLALVIYGEYHQDCEQWQQGNPMKEALFNDLRIMPHVISEELVRDPRDVIFSHT